MRSLVRLGSMLDALVFARKPSRELPDATVEGRRWPRRTDRVLDALKSFGVGLLLFSVVVSAIAGAEGALFLTMLAAWLLFPLLVGLEDTLDAGCAFMLVSLGVVVVVSVARDGPGPLLP